MRFDLAFFLCCCRSFLGSESDDEEDYYGLLQIERDATADEIKKAYKKQSLLMHPDKLAQRGQKVTVEDQARFTRMKEAYEVLSDPYKKETYDAIGQKGMRWIDEPFSVDPQELAHNFAKSSILDRSKIFAIFIALAIAVLLLPLLVCFHVDGMFGDDALWLATLIPLWLWDVFILFYHARVIMMGPIPRPDHIPPEEWIDPLPMKKRYFSLGRFLLIVLFEILLSLKLDDIAHVPWAIIFFPLYVWEATTLYKKWPLARMRIVTVADLEQALGKPFSEFTPSEKELIGQRYSVVPSLDSPDFDAAQKLKTRARHDIMKSFFRIGFCLLLLLQLDFNRDWNWWLIFLPFWIMTGLICYANYQAFADVQQTAMEKDPTILGLPPKTENETQYGAVGADGAPSSPLSEQEREELKAQVLASSSRLCSKCCSQGFFLFIVVLVVAKLQGAGFSSLWIISPFLLMAGIILCCLGCAIFGITEVSTDGVQFDVADWNTVATGEEGVSSPTYNPPKSAVAPESASCSSPVTTESPVALNPTNAADSIPETTALTANDIESGTQTLNNTQQSKQETTHVVDLLNEPSVVSPKAAEFHELD